MLETAAHKTEGGFTFQLSWEGATLQLCPSSSAAHGVEGECGGCRKGPHISSNSTPVF